jgi:uncharacterized protein (TIGR02001 family)
VRFVLVLLGGSLLTGTASAQVSLTLTGVSDYRFRGISQSGGDPAIQGSVVFGHRTGLYAGAFASTVDLGPDSSGTFEAFVHAGYARRAAADFSWEVGGGHYGYHGSGSVPDWNYAEAYVGATWRTFGLRLSYAPDYYNSDTRLAYLELSTAHAVSERAALFGYFGVTRLDGGYAERPGADRARVDARFGVSFDLGIASLEVSAVATDIAAEDCPVGGGGCDPGVVVALSRTFRVPGRPSNERPSATRNRPDP